MANVDLLIISSERKKRSPSSSLDLDLNSVIIGGLGITESGGHFDFGGSRITNVADPTSAQDVATKAYVDMLGGGSSLVAGDGIDITSDVVSVVAADDSILVDSSGVSVDYTQTYTNVEGASITAGQVVYNPSFGNVELVSGSTVGIGPGSVFGIVSDASISDTAAGRIYVKTGAIISGFSGLTVGDPVYVHQSTDGATTQSTASFTTGQHVVQLGVALTTTTILFNPAYVIQL